MNTNTRNSSADAWKTAGDARTNHVGRASILRRSALAATVAALGSLAAVSPVRAHEEDYYPDDSTVTSIPDTARNIIEESSGGSTTLIYAGIAILGLAGVAVLALNLVKGRGATGANTPTDTE